MHLGSSPTTRPSWFNELIAALRQPKKAWCDEEQISFVVAARELNAWLHDKRPYDGKHKQGWKSALRDFVQAVGDLGPEAIASLSGELPPCQSIAQHLQQSTASGFEALLVAQRGVYRAAFGALLNRLGQADVRLAVWKDLVATCRTPTTSYRKIAVRRDLFWAVIRASESRGDRVGGDLQGVLADNAFEVRAVRLSLGEADPSKATIPPRPNEAANLTEGERLSLCERLLTLEPVPARHVVWVAFEKASLARMMQTVGPITFYDAHWIKSCLDMANFPAEFPEELEDRSFIFESSDLPEERDTVLARVDLGTRSLGDPVTVARKQAEAVVAVAGFGFGKPRWRILQGYLQAVDGRLRGMGAFMTPLDTDSLSQSASSDPMSDLLSKVEAELSPHLPVDNPDLAELIDAVHAWQRTSRDEPLSSIILDVRILELIASRVTHGSWYGFLDDYLSSAWVRHKILNWVHATAYEAGYTHIDGLSSDQKQERRELQLKVFRSTGYGHQVDLAKAYEALPQLVGMFPSNSEPYRKLNHAVSALSSPASITSLRDDLHEQWSLTRERLQRLRNALAHGGPVDVEGAKTVHGFVRLLAAWSISRSLEGILNGNGVVADQAKHRDEANSWYQAVPSASDAESALFPS